MVSDIVNASSYSQGEGVLLLLLDKGLPSKKVSDMFGEGDVEEDLYG